MFVFDCARCCAELTGPLSEMPLPVHAHQSYGNTAQLPVLMDPGTFAVEPEPWGPPRRRWSDIDPAEAEARGVYAPVPTLSDGLPGAIVIAPGDMRGTRLIPDRAAGSCCGLDGSDGPNLACEVCGLAVASRIDDCSLWQAVWLAPNAVTRRSVGSVDASPTSWEELIADGEGTPPLEPVSTWGGRAGLDHYWSWSPRWEAAAGRALAHLLAASGGVRVTVPDGLSAEVFQRTLDALLPLGPPERRAVPAGPGLPLPRRGADILLAPVHPQTGRVWAPAAWDNLADLVPLPLGVWLWMAFPKPHWPTLATGALPADVLREDPLPPRPHTLFRADFGTFQGTLVRLPAVRRPWLRAIYERVSQRAHCDLFW